MTLLGLRAPRRHVGIALALGVAATGVLLLVSLTPWLSALLVAIVVGALIGNLRILPTRMSSSVSWASKKYLRVGIVLLGFKLSLASLAAIGLEGMVVLITTVVATFFGTLALGVWLRIPRVTRMLVATGFAICGASAIAAMSSVVDPDGKEEDQTAQAVALVTIFGTFAMFGLPPLAKLLQMTDLQAGLWLGASIHEVAQVVAAGGMVSAAALATATVAKLGRVVLLAPLIAVFTAVNARTSGVASQGHRPPVVPLFVAGFLAAIAIRTFGSLPEGLLHALEFGANLLLTAAMLGLGLGVDIRKLTATGWRPFALGALSTVLAIGVALIAIAVLGI